MPARCYANLLRDWATYGATDVSYRESQTVLARILGLSFSLQSIETEVVGWGGCHNLLCAASRAGCSSTRRDYPSGESGWQRGADGTAAPSDAACAPGQGPELRGRVGQVCPQTRAEGGIRLWNPDVRGQGRLVYTTRPAPDRSI